MSNNAKTNRPQFSTLVNTVEVTYDATVDGGAIGEGTLPFKLNPGQIIKMAFLKTTTDFASSGAATISFGFEASDPDNLVDDTAKATLASGALVACIPVNTVATFIENTTSAPLQLRYGVKTAALTAGAVKIVMDILKP